MSRHAYVSHVQQSLNSNIVHRQYCSCLLCVAPLRVTLSFAQGDAAKAEADKKEAARKEIAELMAKAKADMDKEDKKDTTEAEAAQHKADDLQKEVLHSARVTLVGTK